MKERCMKSDKRPDVMHSDIEIPPEQEPQAEICDNCRYMMFNKIWYCTQGREENCFGGTCELFDTPF